MIDDYLNNVRNQIIQKCVTIGRREGFIDLHGSNYSCTTFWYHFGVCYFDTMKEEFSNYFSVNEFREKLNGEINKKQLLYKKNITGIVIEYYLPNLVGNYLNNKF